MKKINKAQTILNFSFNSDEGKELDDKHAAHMSDEDMEKSINDGHSSYMSDDDFANEIKEESSKRMQSGIDADSIAEKLRAEAFNVKPNTFGGNLNPENPMALKGAINSIKDSKRASKVLSYFNAGRTRPFVSLSQVKEEVHEFGAKDKQKLLKALLSN